MPGRKPRHQLPERVSITEAARVLGVDPQTIRRRINAGELAAERVFSNGVKPIIRIRRDEIEKSITPIEPINASGASVSSPDVRAGRNGGKGQT